MRIFQSTSFYVFLLAVFTGLVLSQDEPAPKEEAKFENAVLIRFEDEIHLLSQAWLERKLDEAQSMDPDLVIIEIDSGGGLLESSLELADRFRTLEFAPIVAYIPDLALSGAAIMALGCDQIIMHPEANIGDAGPIVEGEDKIFRHASEKIVSHLATEIRTLAEANDRPGILAEAMVDLDLEVFQVEHKDTGEIGFFSQLEWNNLDNKDEWINKKLVIESQDGRFLEVTGKRAVELGLADAVVNDEDELKELLGISGNITRLEYSNVDMWVYILNLSVVTWFLFFVALICLYFELQFPGLSVAGLISIVCFSLFFWSRFLGGTADYLELILFAIGILLIVMELFVVPGFGVFGLGGLLLVGGSLILASQDVVIPTNSLEFGTFMINFGILVSSFLVVLVTASTLSQYLGSIPVVGRIVLKPPTEDETLSGDHMEQNSPAAKGLSIGQRGRAHTMLRPLGKARLGHFIVDVEVEDDIVERGTLIEIADIVNHRVMVKRVEE